MNRGDRGRKSEVLETPASKATILMAPPSTPKPYAEVETEFFIQRTMFLAKLGLLPSILGLASARGTCARVAYLSERVGRSVSSADDVTAAEWRVLNSDLLAMMFAGVGLSR